MTKIYTPDSSPEELQEFTEGIKSAAEFLNSNPEAKALMEDPETRNLSEDEFVARLLSIADEADSNQ